MINSGITATISGVTIENGRTSIFGGGIYNGGTLTVTNSTLSGNSAGTGAGAGGGIWNDYGATATVSNSTFSGNTASGSTASTGAGAGGGIYNGGTLTVTNSTFSGNSTHLGGVDSGGGIYSNGTLTVTNSTFSGNSAGGGGGILNGFGGRLTVTSSTFSGNSARVFGGGTGNFGTLTLRNTIIANSTSGGNCGPPGITSTDGGYNLADDGTCLFTATGSANNVTNLKLGVLSSNGGPTQTIPVLAGSVAIDAIPVGTNGCGTAIIADQRGVARPRGPACDIGAFELEVLNQSPVANAGPDQTVSVGTGCAATVSLNGSGSSDPDGYTLSFQWTNANGTSLGSSAVINLTLGLGTHTFTLTVNDGKGGTASDSVTITVLDTTAPITNAAYPAANANGWYNTNVTVTLTASDNCSVKEIVYSLSGAQTGGAGVAGSSASVTISAEGATTLSYFARDNAGNQEVSRSLSVKIDKTPPTLACDTKPKTLWPPDHKMTPVSASVTVADPVSGPAGFTLVSVTSNEPDQGLRDGDFANDIQEFALGGPDTSGLLRAERSGLGTGRVYTLTYRGMDAAGNSATCGPVVTVPRDLRP